MEKSNPRIIVVYFSYDETVEKIATEAAKALGADTLRLLVVEKQDEPRVKYLWGNDSVSMNPNPVLQKLDPNPEDYDLILLGSPVWSMNYAPPFRSFFKEVNLEGKMVGIFCVHEGVPGIVFDEFEKALIGNNIMGKLSLQLPEDGILKDEPSEAATWARELMNKAISLQ